MKIQTYAGQLKAALKLCEPFVDKRVFIPVLSMVKFEKGKIVATNLDMQIEVLLPSVSNEGAALVMFWPLRRLVADLKDEELVTLTRVGNAVEIIAGTGRYLIPSLSTEEFPEIKLLTQFRDVKLDGDAFRNALLFALPAVSTEETRYYLNGVCLSVHDVVATDGHRLAVSYGILPEAINNAIIPRAAAIVLSKLPAFPSLTLFSGGDVDHVIRFGAAGVTVTAKLIDGTYPDWKRVVPSGGLATTHLQRADLSRLLRRMSVVTGMRAFPVTLAADGVRLAASVKDVSSDVSAQDYIDAHGAEFEVAFNARYLNEALVSIGGETVSFATLGSTHPVILRSDQTDNRAFIVMPQRGTHIDDARLLLERLRRDVAA
ncbi:DNA polymerase III subunit beta [Agrobacterium rosae]|uniref:DNA polymerase III subunit beta n=1 Tax=Agrobacterium rosae TaxID=1972867 RepID=UPI003BA23AF3